jgi:hypothetical protein
MADAEYELHSQDSFIVNDLDDELEEETLEALKTAGNVKRWGPQQLREYLETWFSCSQRLSAGFWAWT